MISLENNTGLRVLNWIQDIINLQNLNTVENLLKYLLTFPSLTGDSCKMA